MDPPIFSHGALLLRVTTLYPPRNNEVTSHLTWIQPFKVEAVSYAWKRKTPKKLMFLNFDLGYSQHMLFLQESLGDRITIQ